jgi:predicted small secreted protein
MKTKFLTAIVILATIFISACNTKKSGEQNTIDSTAMKLNDFATFRLTSDLTGLTDNERRMIPLLIKAADIMNEIFWLESYGEKDSLLNGLDDDNARKLAEIHYGPWDRMNGNSPLFERIGNKYPGANFYPHDMTVEEFEGLQDTTKKDLYTVIRRNEQGNLITVPYHQAFAGYVEKASSLVLQASKLAEDPGLKKYLELRSRALLDDNYRASDMAWMDMKTNRIDFIIGPVETYEDQLYGYKAAHEAYVLIKDMEWSGKLKKYAALLPSLQKGLPVDERYKKEMPGDNSDLGAYDVVYYAGDCNAGSKTIAINLPNDEVVQLAKGSRRLQLKNAMQAKFDKIMLPIAAELLPASQLQHVTFDAFFSNTMFHEVAHGLGCSNTINGKGTVREALKEQYTTLEEGKADILGLYLESKLKEMGELDIDMMNEYTTFMAGIFRSIRFGASSAHGKANLIRFNYFKEKGAFTVDSAGLYVIDFERMTNAINSLSNLILTIQGDGDYEKAQAMIQQYSVMDDDLKAALKKIEEKDIPVDIVFEQGTQVLGL